MSKLAQRLIKENKITKAKTLDLGNCGLTEVPEEIGDCYWLETLILSEGWFEFDFKKKEWKEQKSQNEGEKNQLKSLPPTLSNLLLLNKLFFNKSQVSDLSPLTVLSNLQTLSFGSTKVSDLSPLAALSNLQILRCYSTNTSDLSPLAGLSNLQILSCHSTQVSDLSPLATLSNLRFLYCGSTKVSDLSPLATLSNLQQLSCGSTKVSDLSSLAALSNLQMLRCQSTQVSDLSPILNFLEKGIRFTLKGYAGNREFDFKDCPLTNPPAEIVKQGKAAILNYFKEKQEKGTEKSLEAKVVLVGEGQAGKSSLKTRLLRPGDPLPNQADRTKGLDIEIEKYSFPLASGEIMRLNIFDFGGQDHYKPLHQFFYSKNTLYVLVSKNGDDSTNDFDFWLETAQLFGQNSPVLAVHNLFGDVRCTFNRAKYARFDDILRLCAEVNLADFADRRWDEVRRHIEHFAALLPHVHEEIPKTWANVRRALAARREEQVLPLDEYLRLCALPENGSMDTERALFCSAYLHDIGVLLHYQDDEDLREHVIVKNEWATDAAYRVIDDPEIGKRQGHFFRKTDLPRIWYQPEYAKMRLHLLELMKRFRLCYPLKTDGEFIAPQLLPPQPPDGYSWTEADDLPLFVEYDFMPLGLLSQLIVECHLLIAGERRQVWRDGMAIELPNGGAQGEVTLQKRNGKQTICIRTQGKQRRDLLTIVDGKLEELHRPFGSGLRVEKKIPCVCDRCSKTEDKWFFNLSELENRLRAGVLKKDCEKSYHAVAIHDLLENVFSKNVEPIENLIGGKVKIFISYSHKDEAFKTRFDIGLKPLKRLGKIDVWQDRLLLAGEEFEKIILSEIEKADVVCLLVSPNFLESEYCFSKEMELALQHRKSKGTAIVPIILAATPYWTDFEIGKLNALPKDGKPVSEWENQDSAWHDVVTKIGKLADSLTKP